MTATILITGFGPFPGAPFNPTGALVTELARRRIPALRHIRRVAHVFATSYAAVDRELPALLALLVLDVDADDAGFLEILDHVIDRDGIAVAGVGVGGERDVDAARQVAAGIDIVAQAEDADVGLDDQAEHLAVVDLRELLGRIDA